MSFGTTTSTSLGAPSDPSPDAPGATCRKQVHNQNLLNTCPSFADVAHRYGLCPFHFERPSPGTSFDPPPLFSSTEPGLASVTAVAAFDWFPSFLRTLTKLLQPYFVEGEGPVLSDVISWSALSTGLGSHSFLSAPGVLAYHHPCLTAPTAPRLHRPPPYLLICH